MKKKLSYLLLTLALIGSACSKDECDSASDGTTALSATTRASESNVEAAYRHRLYLVSEGEITAKRAVSVASSLLPFRVVPGNYGLLCVAAENETNLTFPATELGSTVADFAVRITDPAAAVPDLLIGRKNDIVVGASAVVAPIELTRAVARVTINLVGLSALQQTTIGVTLAGGYDQIDADGVPSKSGADFVEQPITLTKDENGRFVGEAIVMPTDLAATTSDFCFTISGKTYHSVQNVRIAANTAYNLTVVGQFSDDQTIKLVPTFSYAPWDEPLDVPDPSLPVIDDRPANADYTVEVYRGGEWQSVFVHNAQVSDYAANPANGYTQHDLGFAQIIDDFATPVKVRVTRKENFSAVEIRPLAYAITPTAQTANTVEFELTAATQKVSVEFDGDRLGNLFLFPDLPDTNIPTGSNVTYFGPGIHNMGNLEILYKSNQTIYLAEGALVYGSIKATGSPNLTIRGRGILCSSKMDHGTDRKPQIETFSCQNFKVEGITLRDTPNWTMKIVGSTGVHIDNVKEIGWIVNSDGMDFICCRSVLVENTFQRNYDDNVTIKAFNGKTDYVTAHTIGTDNFSDAGIWTVYYLAQDQFDVYDYEIRNCVFWADKGHNMVVGPESRGITLKTIKFHHNTVLENRQNDAVYPGTMAVMVADNGIFEDISFEDITVEDINGGKVFAALFANAWSYDGLYGQWAKNITFKNIAYRGTRATKSWLRGRSDTQCIDGVTISNFTVNGAKVTAAGSDLEINAYAKNVTIE